MENEIMDETQTEDLPEGFVEEEEVSEEPLEESIEQEPQEQPKPEGTTEPGYVKRRIDKAVAKAIAETEARMNAEFDKKLAPFRERMLEAEAKELVQQGEFKSLERAKEYLKLKQGQPIEVEQPRNSNGQFSKRDPAQEMQINMLAKQADKIKAETGIDVIDIMSNDDEIREKVTSGEIDFYDVAKMAKPSKRPPSPTRAPNGATSQPNAIDQMTDAQFKRLEKRIQEGARITLR